MSANSSIEWTHHTFNPWWGCVKVSPGCEHCYAETLSARYGHRIWGPAKTTSRRLFGPNHWADPLKWNAAAERESLHHRVFCASMADVFEDHPLLQPARDMLWRTIEATPWLDWLLLTKRPENMARLLPTGWLVEPRPNVWLGTSVEDRRRAAERIPELTKIRAAVRFLSCEPLLESLDGVDFHGVDWAIVGGESGPKARRMDLDWAHAVLRQCRAAGTAYFFKQAGTLLAVELGMSGKGGHELRGLPSELRVREYPIPRRVRSEAQLLAARKPKPIAAA